MDVPLRLLDLRWLVFIPTQHTVTLHASDSMSSATPNCKEPAGCVLCCEAKKDAQSSRMCASIKPADRHGWLFAPGRLRYFGRGS